MASDIYNIRLSFQGGEAVKTVHSLNITEEQRIELENQGITFEDGVVYIESLEQAALFGQICNTSMLSVLYKELDYKNLDFTQFDLNNLDGAVEKLLGKGENLSFTEIMTLAAYVALIAQRDSARSKRSILSNIVDIKIQQMQADFNTKIAAAAKQLESDMKGVQAELIQAIAGFASACFSVAVGTTINIIQTVKAHKMYSNDARTQANEAAKAKHENMQKVLNVNIGKNPKIEPTEITKQEMKGKGEKDLQNTNKNLQEGLKAINKTDNGFKDIDSKIKKKQEKVNESQKKLQDEHEELGKAQADADKAKQELQADPNNQDLQQKFEAAKDKVKVAEQRVKNAKETYDTNRKDLIESLNNKEIPTKQQNIVMAQTDKNHQQECLELAMIDQDSASQKYGQATKGSSDPKTLESKVKDLPGVKEATKAQKNLTQKEYAFTEAQNKHIQAEAEEDKANKKLTEASSAKRTAQDELNDAVENYKAKKTELNKATQDEDAVRAEYGVAQQKTKKTEDALNTAKTELDTARTKLKDAKQKLYDEIDADKDINKGNDKGIAKAYADKLLADARVQGCEDNVSSADRNLIYAKAGIDIDKLRADQTTEFGEAEKAFTAARNAYLANPNSKTYSELITAQKKLDLAIDGLGSNAFGDAKAVEEKKNVLKAQTKKDVIEATIGELRFQKAEIEKQATLAEADIDIDKLRADQTTGFGEAEKAFTDARDAYLADPSDDAKKKDLDAAYNKLLGEIDSIPNDVLGDNAPGKKSLLRSDTTRKNVEATLIASEGDLRFQKAEIEKQATLAEADIDIDKLRADQTTGFGKAEKAFTDARDAYLADPNPEKYNKLITAQKDLDSAIDGLGKKAFGEKKNVLKAQTKKDVIEATIEAHKRDVQKKEIALREAGGEISLKDLQEASFQEARINVLKAKKEWLDAQEALNFPEDGKKLDLAKERELQNKRDEAKKKYDEAKADLKSKIDGSNIGNKKQVEAQCALEEAEFTAKYYSDDPKPALRSTLDQQNGVRKVKANIFNEKRKELKVGEKLKKEINDVGKAYGDYLGDSSAENYIVFQDAKADFKAKYGSDPEKMEALQLHLDKTESTATMGINMNPDPTKEPELSKAAKEAKDAAIRTENLKVATGGACEGKDAEKANDYKEEIKKLQGNTSDWKMSGKTASKIMKRQTDLKALELQSRENRQNRNINKILFGNKEIREAYGITDETKFNTDAINQRLNDSDLRLSEKDKGELMAAFELRGKVLDERKNLDFCMSSRMQYYSAILNIAQPMINSAIQIGNNMGMLMAQTYKTASAVERSVVGYIQAVSGVIQTFIGGLDSFINGLRQSITKDWGTADNIIKSLLDTAISSSIQTTQNIARNI